MINSEPLQLRAFNQYLHPRYGITITDEQFVGMVGHHERENWRVIRDRYSLTESIDVLVLGRSAVYEEVLRANLVPMPGLLALVTRLFGDHRLAVASSSPMRQIELVVQGLGLRDKFAVLASGYEVARSKPDPALFLLTAARLGVEPSQCLVLEDSAAGLQAAQAAGMHRIAVPNRYTRDQDLSAANATVESLALRLVPGSRGGIEPLRADDRCKKAPIAGEAVAPSVAAHAVMPGVNPLDVTPQVVKASTAMRTLPAAGARSAHRSG